MNKQPRMTNEEAIETIKKNYPPENYTMLREALDIAIEILGNVDPIPLPTIKPVEEALRTYLHTTIDVMTHDQRRTVAMNLGLELIPNE